MGRGYRDLHDIQLTMHGAQGDRVQARRRYVLDTNTVINLVDNPNFRSMLAVRVDMRNSNVYLSFTIRRELQKHGCPLVTAVACIRHHLKANAISCASTAEDRAEAPRLERAYDTLHWPDSMILAETASRGATLVTRDRGLADAAKRCGVSVVNPDLLCT